MSHRAELMITKTRSRVQTTHSTCSTGKKVDTARNTRQYRCATRQYWTFRKMLPSVSTGAAVAG
eukprot:3119366-Rhodomonas_salina.2